MRLILILSLLCTQLLAQSSFEGFINKINQNIKASKYKSYRLPDSTQAYVCEIVVFYLNDSIHKIETGCGDASLTRTLNEYYFKSNKLYIAQISIHYFNAPPTYTEEIAQKEGITSGWFDPRKTKIDKKTYFFKDGIENSSLNKLEKQKKEDTTYLKYDIKDVELALKYFRLKGK